MKSRITLIVIALCLLAASTKAQDRSGNRQAVYRLSGVVVIIGIDDKEPRLLKHARENELRRFTEGELERGGLMIGASRYLTQDPPAFAVMLEASICDGLLAVRIDTSLVDNVATSRDPDTTFRAEIWRESYSVFLSAQDDGSKIRRVIAKCVDLLVSDWKIANPPQKIDKGRDH